MVFAVWRARAPRDGGKPGMPMCPSLGPVGCRLRRNTPPGCRAATALESAGPRPHGFRGQRPYGTAGGGRGGHSASEGPDGHQVAVAGGA